MEKYERMPKGVVAGWASVDVPAEAGKIFPHHFHKLEEWLEILEGDMAFFSAGDSDGSPSWPLGRGQALRIPRGEVHRVVVGERGVTYRMWTPIRAPQQFAEKIDADLWGLIQDNLKIPLEENALDKRDVNESEEQRKRSGEYEFLEGLLTNDLIFRAGTGRVYTKSKYLGRDPSPDKRFSSGSLRILDLREDSLLLSTLVHTGDRRASFVNLRWFVKDGSGHWRCRVWLNYPDIADKPQPGAKPT